MWFWLMFAALALAVGGLGIGRLPSRRLTGAAILAAAVALALVIEVLIRFDAISVDQGTDLMGMATLVLIGLIVTFVARSRSA